MSERDKTFGSAISNVRKKNRLSLKDLSSQIRREDGQAISPQYLNDIEHDHRRPSSDHMVQQLADVLKINPDWLYYLAGRFPADIRSRQFSEKEVQKRIVAFRRPLPSGRGKK